MIRSVFGVACLAFVLLAAAACAPLVEETQSMEADYHYGVGQSYFGQREFQAALAEFNTALQLEPENSVYLEYRGATYVSLSNGRAAIADFTSAERVLPQSPESTVESQRAYIDLERGNAYLEVRDYARAERDFVALSHLRPRYAPAYIDLAEAAFDRHRAQDAVTATSRAITLAPRVNYLYNNRCFYEAATPRLAAALEDCNRALALQKSQPFNRLHTLSSRAVVYLKLSQAENAVADCNAALKIAPQDADSLYLRGVAERDRGDASEASRDIAAALTTKPGLPAEYAIFRLANASRT
jgi:tetratricopeptide (TPR) repeat protein